MLKKLFKAKREKRIDFFKKRLQKRAEKLTLYQNRKKKIRGYLDKAGIAISSERLSKLFFNAAILINLGISAYLIYHFSTTLGVTWSTVLTSMLVLWVFVFAIVLFLLWIVFYITIDLRIFKRKVEIEDVFPDFLQLAASNIKAGMTIDKALWYAVRPRFGVLAKEIEDVAKETMSGSDLKESLQKFTARYNSVTLKRSINMLIEGIEAGGEIGDLLDKIANNIKEQKIMAKEIGASVTTYTIFISFSSMGGAPLLFALSGALIRVIQNLGTTLGNITNTATTVGLPLSFSGAGITETDFRIFSILMIIITSCTAAMMVATIKKGNVKSGIKYIPAFTAVSLIVYFASLKAVGTLLGVVF